jgi:hypothetical protein
MNPLYPALYCPDRHMTRNASACLHQQAGAMAQALSQCPVLLQ